MARHHSNRPSEQPSSSRPTRARQEVRFINTGNMPRDPPKEKERIRMAQKRREVLAAGEGFIFVGNLHPCTRESELKEMFRPYGPLKTISIRVARGDTANYDAMSKGVTVQNTLIYAVLTYHSRIHANRALVMDGLQHRDMPMVVTRHASEVPELQEVAEREKARLRAAHEKPSAIKRAWHTLKQLTAERTVILPENGRMRPTGELPPGAASLQMPGDFYGSPTPSAQPGPSRPRAGTLKRTDTSYL
ncbi:RNA recognition motif (RRM)-containing protein [Phanerochaete sordida]|uniref:RNA recognition motif (RRM)-containing protein n=1 Tax=Phanerochaete sordida TaxID=48140 RepID=A0A9P3L8E5_9APHY|nr:RNA recognition motif (RRM)-containing protein [Phanerochaete sordida]